LAFLVSFSSSTWVSAKIRNHFEVIMWGAPFTGPKSKQCATNNGWCFAWRDFNALNTRSTASGIYMAIEGAGTLGTPQTLAARAAGNDIAYYMNDMNAYKHFGRNTAKRMVQDACKAFGGCANVPKFWIMNEIIGELWLQKTYQSWITTFVSGLHKAGFKPIICVSYRWSSEFNVISGRGLRNIVKNGGYLGLELYQTGEHVAQLGYNVGRVRKFYSGPLHLIEGLGIPKKRIMMLEDYGNTAAGSVLGRSGLPKSTNWARAITVRNEAIAALNFGGTITYGWFNNAMHDSPATRDSYYSAHVKSRKNMP